MKATEISEFGSIGNDGKLLLPMGRVREFLKGFAGHNVIVRFEAVEPGTTAAMWGYYNSYVLPTVRRAFYELGERKTIDETDLWLRENCPILDRGAGVERKTVEEMRYSEMAEFLEWIKQMAAENLYIFIYDPRVI